MTTLNYYIGLNDKDLKVQVVETQFIEKVVSEILSRFYQGFTITNCTGYFTHADGSTVLENTLKVTILFSELDEMKFEDTDQVIAMLKAELNQESIGVEMIHSTVAFV